MSFQPKKISVKVKAGDIGRFNPFNSEFVMGSFKTSGKKFRSTPKGFFAIDPAANAIYMGFDYNNDGIISVKEEAFARFTVQINPFHIKTTTDKLVDKFSNPKAKGKIMFKRKDLGDIVAFESSINKNKLSPVAEMFKGQMIGGTYPYDALIDTLLGGEM